MVIWSKRRILPFVSFHSWLSSFEAFQSKGFHTNTNKSRFLHSYDIVKDVKDHRILVNQYQFPLHAFNRIDLSPVKIESFTRHNFEFSHSVLASFFRTFIHITTENGFFNSVNKNRPTTTTMFSIQLRRQFSSKCKSTLVSIITDTKRVWNYSFKSRSKCRFHRVRKHGSGYG